MSAHTEDEFNLFMSQLKETNQTLDFFCDFDKINNNVEEIKLSLISSTLSFILSKSQKKSKV